MNSRTILEQKLLLIVPLIFIIRYGLTFSETFSVFQITKIFIFGMAVTFLVCLINYSFRKMFVRLNVVYLSLYIVFLFIYSTYISDYNNNLMINTYIRKLLILVVLYSVYVFIYNLQSRERVRIVFFFLICITISSVYTLIVSKTVGSDIIRQSSVSSFSEKYSLRYGGYDFIYTLVLTYFSFLVAYLHHKKDIGKIYKVIIILFLISVLFTVVFSGFGSALVFLILGTVFLSVNGKKKYIIIPLLLVVYLFLINENFTVYINNSTLIPSLTKSRIVNVLNLLSGRSESISDYSSRFNKILNNLRIISDYPIFGGVTKVNAFDFGRHTEWLDQIARYGILSFILYSAFWVSTCNSLMKDSNNELSARNTDYNKDNILKSFLFFFFIGVFINFSVDSMAAPLFIFTPFIDELFDNLKKNNYL